MMKKSFLTKSIVAAGIVSCLTSSNAAGLNDMKFYAGAGLDYNMYSFSDAKETYDIKGNGLGFAIPVLGVKFHENFGIEAGYSFNKKIKTNKKTDVNSAGSYKVRNMYLDLVGFMPIAEQFELLGGLGIGKLNLKGSYTPTGLPEESLNESKTSWRAKIGAQYNVISNLAIRAVFSYQKADKDKLYIKNLKNIGLYGIYTF